MAHRQPSDTQQSGPGIITLDEDQRILSLCPVAQSLLDWPATDVLGHSITELVPEFDCGGRRTNAGSNERDWRLLRLRRRDGREISTRLVSQPWQTGARHFTTLLVDRANSGSAALQHVQLQARASEARFSALLHAAVDAIIVIDSQGTVQMANGAAERLFGYPAAEILGQNVTVLMPEPYRSEHDGYIRNYLTTGKARIIGIGRELIGRKKDGETFPMTLGIGEARCNDIRQFVGIIRDLGPRLRALEEIRRQQEDYRLIFESVPALIWYLDEHSRVRRANPAVARVMGRPLEELLGKDTFDLFPTEEAVRFEADNSAIIASGKPRYGMIETFTTANGTHWALTDKIPQFSSDGKPVGIIVVSQDITERKVAEERLRERDQQLRLTIRNAPTGIVTSDLEGRFLSVNQAACAITGYTEAELLGMTTQELTHPGDQRATADLMEQAIAGVIDSWTLKKRYIRKDGTIVHFVAHNIVTHDPAGRPQVIIGQIEDLTERLKAEEEARLHQERLAHVTRLHTLGEMAAGIAHEINQPLTAVSNYAQACRRRLTAGTADLAKVQELLEKINNQAQRAGEVIRRVRSLARKHDHQHCLADINALTLEATEMAKTDTRSLDCRIDLALAQTLPRVFVDPVQIEQVILNLIRNGLDAMETVPVDEREMVIETAVEGVDHVTIRVTDRGIGLPDAAAEQLFDPFFTTKGSGLGVGLSISRSIVTAHGGRIWFTANARRGTTFHFTLPAARGQDHE